MAKLQGAQLRERAKELKPARYLAFKLCQKNPEIRADELNQTLKDNGFDIAKPTIVAWMMRCRKRSSATGTYDSKRPTARKPRPARVFAFKFWQENPQTGGAELFQALKKEGLQARNSICYYWLRSFRKGKDGVAYEQKPLTAEEPSEITSAITLEQIIKAAGSVETLSVLFYQGVMRELSRKDAAYHVLSQECLNKGNKISSLKRLLDEVTRERNQVMRDYNEKLAKVKVGTLTLDETSRRLIPKI